MTCILITFKESSLLWCHKNVLLYFKFFLKIPPPRSMFFFLFLILFLTIDSLVFHKTPTPTTPLKICSPRSTFSLQNPQSLFSLTALSSLQHSQLFQALQNVSLAIHSLIFPLTLCLHLICLFDWLYFLCWL